MTVILPYCVEVRKELDLVNPVSSSDILQVEGGVPGFQCTPRYFGVIRMRKCQTAPQTFVLQVAEANDTDLSHLVSQEQHAFCFVETVMHAKDRTLQAADAEDQVQFGIVVTVEIEFACCKTCQKINNEI